MTDHRCIRLLHICCPPNFSVRLAAPFHPASKCSRASWRQRFQRPIIKPQSSGVNYAFPVSNCHITGFSKQKCWKTAGGRGKVCRLLQPFVSSTWACQITKWSLIILNLPRPPIFRLKSIKNSETWHNHLPSSISPKIPIFFQENSHFFQEIHWNSPKNPPKAAPGPPSPVLRQLGTFLRLVRPRRGGQGLLWGFGHGLDVHGEMADFMGFNGSYGHSMGISWDFNGILMEVQWHVLNNGEFTSVYPLKKWGFAMIYPENVEMFTNKHNDCR